MSANIRHSSKSAEHFTPLNIVEAARKVLGQIDLDPATTIEANKFIQAKRIFTKKENGFTQKWKVNGKPSMVFLNPPGGRCDPKTGIGVKDGGVSSAKAWWFKLMEEFNAQRVRAAIFVMFSIELLQSSQLNPPQLISSHPLDYPICFPSKRIAYMTYQRGKFVPSTQPSHASAIVCLCDSGSGIEQDFRRTFSAFGKCIRG